MKTTVRIVSVLLVVALCQTACAQATKVRESFTGGGTGEITDIGNGQFDIAAAGGFSGNRADTYAKWDRTAKAACSGGEYKVIKREWQSAEYPGLLGGVVECTKKKK